MIINVIVNNNKAVKIFVSNIMSEKGQTFEDCMFKSVEPLGIKDKKKMLKNIKWLKHSYVDFLRLWQPRFEDFEITNKGKCGLSIETKGTWLNTSMYEIPTLAIVNEVYFRMAYDYDKLLESFKIRLAIKISKLISGEYSLGAFSEFGLRRRLSAQAQDLAVFELAAHNNEIFHFSDSKFVGTSNVYLAKKYGLTPVGTITLIS